MNYRRTKDSAVFLRRIDKRPQTPKKLLEKLYVKDGLSMQEVCNVLGYDNHRYDFKISNSNIIVEMDGVFWHSTPKHVERDRNFDDTAHRHGYKVIRITDEDVKKNSGIFAQRILPLLEESNAN